MPDCPLADECPSFAEQIDGMGCQYYGDRGGKEWCNHYHQPIEDLKTAPVHPGEEIVVDVTDLHESGAGIGHTEEGFVVMVDGVLPEARARVEVETVKSNYARAKLLEKVPIDESLDESDDEDGGEDEGVEPDEEEEETKRRAPKRPPQLGSRENFWGS
ncbi:TRAM domain-containing protein [Halobacteriaceae archaeon GCM10025711]